MSGIKRQAERLAATATADTAAFYAQLAAEYAWRHAAAYRLVWWVEAETPAGMAAGLAELAGELGLADGDVPTRARRALAELGRRDGWLLVYDNLTDPAALARLLPPPGGHLIVTCRDPAVRRVGVDLVEVGEFTRPETVALLRRHAPGLDGRAADRLAAAVGDLPLAADQAGAYLAETGMDPQAYLDLLAAQPQIALAGETLHHPGLAATVAAARARLAEAHPGAAPLLDQLAFLAPEPVPLAAAPAGAGEPVADSLLVADPAATHTAVAAISRLALARRTGTGTGLQIHRLVHALLRARLDPEQTRAALAGALRLLATATVGDDMEDPSNRPGYAAVAPHLTAVAAHLGSVDGVEEPDRFRRLLARGIRYVENTGQLHTAKSLAEQTRTRWSTTLGDDHPDSQRITAVLAEALGDLGDHQAARQLSEDTLVRRRRLYGDDDPATLASALSLAVCLSGLGELHAARALTEDTLVRERRVLGPDHPTTLITAKNLAVYLSALGEHQAARALAEDTLSRRRRLHGEGHPYTLVAVRDLAHILAALGDHRAARALAEDALAQMRRVLGPDDLITLSSAVGLVGHRSTLGDHHAARVLAEDTFTRLRRVLGPDNYFTLYSADRLVVSLAALGDHQAARALSEDTLARRRRLYGDGHPDTQASAGNLADVLRALGEDVEAVRLEDELRRGR